MSYEEEEEEEEFREWCKIPQSETHLPKQLI
jgi:hypothetical protein